MNLHFFRLLRAGFMAMDLAMLNAAFALVKYFSLSGLSEEQVLQYTYAWVVFNVAWLLAGQVCSTYKPINMTSFEIFGRLTLRAYIYFTVSVLLYLFMFKQGEISRIFIVLSLLAFGVLILLNRIAYLLIYQRFRYKDELLKKVVIVGYNEVAKKLVKQLEEDALNTRVIGFCEEQENVHELSNYPILGDLDSIIRVAQENQATEIYSTIPPDQNERIFELIHEADTACIRFRMVPNFNFFTHYPMHIDYIGSIPVLSLRKEPLDDVANRIRKRLFDFLFSFLVIVFVLSWLIPIVGLLIKLSSRGPVFFLQQRTGKDKKPFNCIKFRSMRVNALSDLKQATKGDKRITRIGEFLRKSNLDEFPQFLNVFMGQMSIVGPRPHMLKHTDDYSAIVNKYMVRQFIKPGITGLAQVNGMRGETKTIQEIEKRVEYDIWYLENWSLWLDMRIIFLTVYNMVKGEENAY